MAIMDKDKLLLSVQRALLFNILNSVRFIFIENQGDKILLTIYSDNELTTEEKDIYFAVLGEILGDFSNINDSASEVIFMINDIKFEKIKNQGILVYARYEDIGV
jgi:hypothetical protein